LVVRTDSTTPARLRLRPLGPLTFQLAVDGQIKQQYWIQRSENLATWVPLTSIVATNGVVQFLDSVTSNVPMRFYRAVVP